MLAAALRGGQATEAAERAVVQTVEQAGTEVLQEVAVATVVLLLAPGEVPGVPAERWVAMARAGAAKAVEEPVEARVVEALEVEMLEERALVAAQQVAEAKEVVAQEAAKAEVALEAAAKAAAATAVGKGEEV